MPSLPPPIFTQDLTHVLGSPMLHQMAEDLNGLLARRHRHPLALQLAYLAVQRAAGSANKLDAMLLDQPTWRRTVDTFNGYAELYGTPRTGPHLPSINADAHRAARSRLVEGIEDVCHSLTLRSVAAAMATGLLPASGGSLTRPLPTRTLYGDGTIVRPLYRPGQSVRQDPSAARHTRHDGAHWGNNLVTAYVRGPGRHHRFILGVARTPEPGGEAATAVTLFEQVVDITGAAVQAIVYDGAFRGVHHNTLMSAHGVIVVNRVHGAARPGGPDAPRIAPLVTRRHEPAGRPCLHTLVTVDGSICEVSIDAAGRQHTTDPLERVQVRRTHSQTKGYRFSLGVRIPCPADPFTAWIAVRDHADHMRLLPPTAPDFAAIYGLRNDSESNNQAYKRTLPHRRAAGLGWQRQLLDAVGWAILVNSRAYALHGPGLPEPASEPAHAWPTVQAVAPAGPDGASVPRGGVRTVVSALLHTAADRIAGNHAA